MCHRLVGSLPFESVRSNSFNGQHFLLQNVVWGQKDLDLDVALILTAMYLWASHISSPSLIVPRNRKATQTFECLLHVKHCLRHSE